MRSCAPGRLARLEQPLRQRRKQRVGHQRGLARARDAGDAHERARAGSRRRCSSGCSRARRRCGSTCRCPGAASAAPAPRASPLRNWPVSESGVGHDVARSCPSATTWPPCSPAPGPMSTIQSAARIVSSSCSTTISVLPRSRRRLSVRIRRALSRWCRPMLGSSRMYSTPVRPEPICVARRMRCASPPESVAAVATQRQIVQADVDQEAQPLADLLQDLPPDRELAVGQRQVALGGVRVGCACAVGATVARLTAVRVRERHALLERA